MTRKKSQNSKSRRARSPLITRHFEDFPLAETVYAHPPATPHPFPTLQLGWAHLRDLELTGGDLAEYLELHRHARVIADS
jgi:hypothetical protein